MACQAAICHERDVYDRRFQEYLLEEVMLFNLPLVRDETNRVAVA